jgi:hypothetical protein
MESPLLFLKCRHDAPLTAAGGDGGGAHIVLCLRGLFFALFVHNVQIDRRINPVYAGIIGILPDMP